MTIKIACCISGYPTEHIVEHLRHLVKYKTQMDFFLFFWDTINYDTKMKINGLLQPKEVLYRQPIQFPFDAVFKEPDKGEKKHNALSMFYGIAQAQQLRKLYEQRTKKSYDIIIRLRYDIHFINDLNSIIQNACRVLDDCSLVFPWERHHIGICDQIWFGRHKTMDKFTELFQWIHNNINSLFFVNESVLYNFIKACNMNIKCIDIKYILRRDHHINAPLHVIMEEYNKEKTYPWIEGCPERRDGKYQIYISNKNESANVIYFFTRRLYVDIPCKILNASINKYIHITENDIAGSNIFTHFTIRTHNSYLVNIIVNNPVMFPHTPCCLAVENDKLVCINDFNNINSHFMLLKKGKNYYLSQNRVDGNKKSLPNGVLIYMTKAGKIMVDGERNMCETEWVLF